MKRTLATPAFLLAVFTAAQTPPEIEWQACLGGSGFEEAWSSEPTADGGYIIAGSTDSNNGQVTGFHGGARDFWVVKLDATGTLQWQKALGGSGTDDVGEIQQTSDGGYIVAGTTSSNDGDVSGNHGSGDYWVVKLDPLGDIQWQHTYGGSSSDGCWAVKQTTDGGYVLAGSSSSTDGDVIGNDGGADMWVVRLDPLGSILWQRSFGGNFGEVAFALDLTSDGGVVLAGYAESTNGEVVGNHGMQDYWIVKVDAAGDLQWQRCAGGSADEIAFDVLQTIDGGFAAVGRTDSDDGDVSGHHGDADMWVAKLDANGELIWQKALGGSASDVAYSIIQSPDGSLITAGYTGSEDGDVSEPTGGGDLWIVKLSNEGDLLWEKSMGGSGGEQARSISRTPDGGFLVGGGTNSNNGDVSGNHGSVDLWVVKLLAEPNSMAEEMTQSALNAYPNPAGSQLNVDLSFAPPGRCSFIWKDAAGRILFTGSIHRSAINSDQTLLSTDWLLPGAYVLTIATTKASRSTTVIKVD